MADHVLFRNVTADIPEFVPREFMAMGENPQGCLVQHLNMGEGELCHASHMA